MTLLLLGLLACGGGSALDDIDAEPEPIGLAECAVCGMVVREQPSPRGQLVYRNGDHAHVCSLEELRALAGTPSFAGRPTHVFVEALAADFDWTVTDVAEQPWTDAREAHFVFGAPRERVMGVPVLSFADEQAAATAASRLGTTPVDWAALVGTPVPQIPPQANGGQP